MSLGFTGTWFSSFGRMALIESGNHVTGTYTHKNGLLQGTRDGALLRARWTEGDRSGPAELTLDPGGNAFHGGWSHDGDEGFRGRWEGVRLTLASAEEGGSPGAGNSLSEGPLLSGPMVGEVGETSALVWAQARDTAPLTLVIVDPAGERRRITAQPSWGGWCVVHFHVEGLAPGSEFSYQIESAHGITPPQRLRTAPAPDARQVKIALGSCFDDWQDDDLAVFHSIRREEPDLFLMIGDNCYYEEPDWQTQHTMMLAQLRNRNNASLRALLAEVPALAIWDDHDYGPNDSDGSFVSKQDALAVFQRVWAQRGQGREGVYFNARFGPVELFFTDGRYHRREGNHILGETQLAWLCARLEESEAPIKLVVSGSQVLAQGAAQLGWECWQKDAPGELARLLSFLDEREIGGVVFLSGDVHLGYLLHRAGAALSDGRRGAERWELTASPLANEPWRETIVGKGIDDPTLVAEHAAINYGVVDVDLDRAGAEVRLVLAGEDGEPLATVDVPIEDLAPR